VGTRAAPVLGLIAGGGNLPLEVARGLRRAGQPVRAVGFHGFTRPDLAACVEILEWVHLGEVRRLLETLQGLGVRETAVVGGIPKEVLFAKSSHVRPDSRAFELLASLRDKGDDAILRAVGSVLEEAGIPVRKQNEIAPHLLAPAGPLGSISPGAAQRADIAFAWPLAKTLGRLDIGQTVIVREGVVLAVEAVEGTDAAIRRGAELAAGDVSVIKVLKPTQDTRFDYPTIGARTGETLVAAGATLLAIEAGHCFVVEREQLLALTEAAGICVYGVAPEEFVT